MAALSAAAAPPQIQQSQPTPMKLEDTFSSFIDLSTLTQSELFLLSRRFSPSHSHSSSSSSFIPAIDRSTFNESAGSRRQTFCRPVHHHRSRVAVAGRLSSSNKSISVGVESSNDNPYHSEDRSIIASLKDSLRSLPEFYDIDFNYSPPIAFGDYSNDKKRKRGRKPKIETEGTENYVTIKETSVEVEEIVNENGVRVDLRALAEMEDPFGPELSRRTEGMRSEEELLVFLRDLGGQWCSRRRRRKIVDAGVLGDCLPVGWKLLLGLKRKGGSAWVYCRRYISLGGKQFVSCKEVSEYLQSFFELHMAPSSSNQDKKALQQDDVGSICSAGAIPVQNADKQSDEQHKVTLPGVDDPEDVQIHDMFECNKCSMTFGRKDEYLQHLIAIHQKSSRRNRAGSSVGDGVIVKDGKFECQFCHKVFDERRRYNGHVGIHVRNYVRGVDEKPGQLTLEQSVDSMDQDDAEARISRMDALIEIAQNSMLEISLVPSDEPVDEFPDALDAVNDELPASGSENKQKSEFSLGGVETNDGLTLENSFQGHLQENNENVLSNEMQTVEGALNVDNIKVEFRLDSCISDHADGTGVSQSNIYTEYELLLSPNKTLQESGRESSLFPLNNQDAVGVSGELHSIYRTALDSARAAGEGETASEHIQVSEKRSELADVVLEESLRKTSLEMALHQESTSLMQASQALHSFSSVLQKDEDGSTSINHDKGSVARIRELRLDEFEELNLNFRAEQEYHSAPIASIDLAIGPMEETNYDPSARFEAQEMVLEMGGGNHLTTVCVWCGIEFSHHAEESGTNPSDSVGYMCLSCKAKISGQIGTLDGNSTLNFF